MPADSRAGEAGMRPNADALPINATMHTRVAFILLYRTLGLHLYGLCAAGWPLARAGPRDSFVCRELRSVS